jgi:membrane associated rhomboid family serine protease
MTIFIIIITVIISLVCFNNEELNRKLILNPYTVKRNKEWYRLVTSGFQHADFLHLFVNMFVLYSFGQVVESAYGFMFGSAGKYLYVVMYLTAIFAANVSTYYKYKDRSYYNALGASGAVSAVLFTSIFLDPLNDVYVYFIKVPGVLFGVLYLGYSYYSSKKQNDNINHEAHFYGAIYGIVFLCVFNPKLPLYYLSLLTNLFR